MCQPLVRRSPNSARGAYDAPSDSLVRWGGEHPLPIHFPLNAFRSRRLRGLRLPAGAGVSLLNSLRRRCTGLKFFKGKETFVIPLATASRPMEQLRGGIAAAAAEANIRVSGDIRTNRQTDRQTNGHRHRVKFPRRWFNN